MGSPLHEAPSESFLQRRWKILVVEDDEDILNLIAYNLKGAGFHVLTVRDGLEALQMAKEEHPDLIILDLMLPGMDGIEVCKLLKGDGRTREIPVVMVTAKGEEVDRILGLEIGAEDYIVKPFSPRELILRIKAIIKRVNRPPAERIISLGPITIDLESHEVWVEERKVDLTPTEFRLLHLFLERPGRVMSRDFILDRVWGEGCYVTPRTVDTHIARLREKLGRAGRMIETERGFGYRMRME